MYTLEVLNPVAQQRGALESRSTNPRLSTLEGKTVGLLWSGTAMGDVALRRVGEMLRERFSDIETRFYKGGLPAPPHVIERAAAECDLVVGATAD